MLAGVFEVAEAGQDDVDTQLAKGLRHDLAHHGVMCDVTMGDQQHAAAGFQLKLMRLLLKFRAIVIGECGLRSG